MHTPRRATPRAGGRQRTAAGPLVLYSANTWLAFALGERYYQSSHFVWCSPFRGYSANPAPGAAVPPSSSPLEIYRGLLNDVNAGDEHSAKIAANRAGLLKGATIRKDRGAIDEAAFQKITAAIDRARLRDFRPLLYVIPYRSVAKIAREVPVGDKAHPLAEEYIIEDLRAGLFDILELPT